MATVWSFLLTEVFWCSSFVFLIHVVGILGGVSSRESHPVSQCLKNYFFFKIFFDVDHFLSLLTFYHITSVLCFIIFLFGHRACRILAPWPGSSPPALEGEALTTGPWGKSLKNYFLKPMTTLLTFLSLPSTVLLSQFESLP